MQRRTFLYHSLLGSTTLLLPVLPACRPKPNSAEPDDISGSVPSFSLEEATIPELQQGMESGKYTARSITQMYLERIEAIDQNGPTLRSVIEVNPDALSIADQRDEERQQGKLRGPLHGIPVLLKDNIDTDDRMETTAGSLALVGVPVAQDAWVTQRLREAGAVILGKTNLSEWANFRSERSIERLEWAGRTNQKPLRARPQPLRLQCRVGRGGVGQLVRRGHRHRNQRIYCVPLHHQRHRGHQTHRGAGGALGHHSYFAYPGHGGPDGAHRH